MRLNKLVLSATAALLFAGPAWATGLSMNEAPLAAGTTLDQCKAAGKKAISEAGLKAGPESPLSVFGMADPDILAAIYCLPDRGIAVVAVAGTDNQYTRPVLAKLLAGMGVK